MDKQRINTFIIIFEILTVAVLVALLHLMNDYNTELNKKYDDRTSMLQVADVLRQSSDDLTHFARTYVITGDKKFKEQYFTTLDIRNGKKPRPLHYEAIYWDLPKELRDLKHPPTKNVSLKELIHELPFSRYELDKLSESENNSNDLVNLEVKAFNAMEGKFLDENMQYTIHKDKDQKLAIQLLHSPEYYKAKEKIMTPIDEFTIHLNERTNDSVKKIVNKIADNYILFLIFAVIFVVSNIFIFLYLRKKDKKEQEEKNQLITNASELAQKLNTLNEELEDKILQRTKELEIAKLKAEESSKMKSRFLANMSHEIRTPMNGIVGFTTLLQKSPLDSKQRRYIDIIKKSTHSLLGIINDILDFSKIESGKIELDMQDVHPHVEFDFATGLYAAQMQEKNITFNIHLDENLPECIHVDMLRLKQVISNLISNALKFTPDGGIITFSVTMQNSAEQVQFILFSVKDTGIGIPEDKQQMIFEAFTQADNSTTRQFGGTGLGLSISANLVHLMGGELQVNSQIDQGSEFYFSIPLIICNCTVEEESQKLLDKSSEESSERIYSGRVLLAEDNRINRILMEEIFKEYDVEYESVENGLEAYEKASSGEYDLILMDINMPVMNGVDSFMKIRLNGTQTPVIALTANAMQSDKERLLKQGFNGYISKPIKVEDLKEAFDSYLKK